MRKILNIILVIMISLGLTGCGLTWQNNKDKLPIIGVLMYDYDDEFVSDMRNTMEDAARNKAKLIVNDSRNDQLKQYEQVDIMVAKEVDAFAINLVDASAAPSIAEKAKEANIPLVFFNKEYEEGTDKIPYDKAVYVGANSKQAGKIQGELIIEAWNNNPDWDVNGDDKIQYVMLKGEPEHVDTKVRTEEVIKTIEKSGIQTEEIETQSGMWKAQKANKIMNNWLGKYGSNIEMVISNNDSMALGAIEALRASGYFSEGKYIPVVGIDGRPEAVSSIKRNELLGTVLNDSKVQAEAVIEMAINAAIGNEFLDETSLELDETKAVRIPYVKID